MSTSQIFFADAVLFDMDGTLTDSIAAVEAAWGKVAQDIGQDPSYVIAATHGKRAIDNLKQFKSHIAEHQMDAEVEAFERSILFYADAYNMHGPGLRDQTHSSNSVSPDSLTPPELSPGSSAPSSRASSFAANSNIHMRRPSLASHLSDFLTNVASSPFIEDQETSFVENTSYVPRLDGYSLKKALKDELAAWQLEAASVDRCVRILPGVKKMISSIPDGRYAVATSGAKTYAYGCMTRVGITPPPVTITADDKRLKAGKPAPDPFLLAAKCLGFPASRCVVFEDSPSGIRAGVASGATVIAVCTSHTKEKIENCGAHYLVENMEQVTCDVNEDGSLKFTVRC